MNRFRRSGTLRGGEPLAFAVRVPGGHPWVPAVGRGLGRASASGRLQL